MVELNNKYKIGIRRFGLINWIGFYTLYKKETLRFLIVFGQTIVGPMLTGILFLIVISIAWGDDRGEVLGLPFIEFLAPGLISMQVIQQAFSHSSSSILMGKVMGNIVDLIGSPLSAAEVTLAIVFASVTRSFIICIVSIICFNLLVDVKVLNYYYFFAYLIFSSFFMGSLGFIAGMWAEKFDNMATVTNFIIVPLSFLSGAFYSIERLQLILSFHLTSKKTNQLRGYYDFRNRISIGVTNITLIIFSRIVGWLDSKGLHVKLS